MLKENDVQEIVNSLCKEDVTFLLSAILKENSEEHDHYWCNIAKDGDVSILGVAIAQIVTHMLDEENDIEDIRETIKEITEDTYKEYLNNKHKPLN